MLNSFEALDSEVSEFWQTPLQEGIQTLCGSLEFLGRPKPQLLWRALPEEYRRQM